MEKQERAKYWNLQKGKHTSFHLIWRVSVVLCYWLEKIILYQSGVWKHVCNCFA